MSISRTCTRLRLSKTHINNNKNMNTMEYDLELEKVIKNIMQEKAKLVCIQLPDGLKPRAKEITDAIRQQTGSEAIIWAGSCFGACDVPLEVEKLGVDLIIQWGHSAW